MYKDFSIRLRVPLVSRPQTEKKSFDESLWCWSRNNILCHQWDSSTLEVGNIVTNNDKDTFVMRSLPKNRWHIIIVIRPTQLSHSAVVCARKNVKLQKEVRFLKASVERESFKLVGSQFYARGAVTENALCRSHAASRYCFCRCLCVCLCDCPHKISKILIRNWCYLIRICPMVKARSGWKLVTFDLDLWPWELFSYFSAQAVPFEWLYLATSFLALWYNFRISRSRFSFKVLGPRSKYTAVQKL